ncbi:MAG: hypothetical protein NC548_13840 [Lachnospiraceae bacterium]|nr:hypothetical protein [Lachnospiraceae bacterium]
MKGQNGKRTAPHTAESSCITLKRKCLPSVLQTLAETAIQAMKAAGITV